MKVIISEDQQKILKTYLHSMIKNYGMDIASQAVNGKKNLMKMLNIDSPMDFLHLFDDLDVVQSEKEKNWTLFRYKPKHNLMIYDRENEVVYIDYNNLWTVLRDNFGLKHSETQQLTKEWLYEVYNLRGVTTNMSGILTSIRGYLRSTI